MEKKCSPLKVISGVKTEGKVSNTFSEQSRRVSVKKIKFRNWDNYDRRDALKNIVYFNNIRNQDELDENFEMLEKDPKVREHLMAPQG